MATWLRRGIFGTSKTSCFTESESSPRINTDETDLRISTFFNSRFSIRVNQRYQR
jgi:hypothetical protein